MFKRKSTKKLVDAKAVVKEGSSEDDDVVQDRGSVYRTSPSPTNPVDQSKQSSSQNKKEILKEIFKLPADPRFELNSQLVKQPMGIVEEYLPAVLKFAEWSVIFLLGYFRFSYAWIITVSFLYIARNSSRPSGDASTAHCQHEKEALKSKIESLPSWVAFPDVERVEWINIIIKKIWPNIGQISQQIAKRLVEPKVKEILNRMRLEDLSNFKLKSVHLGSIPARVGGIKVYDRNTGRDEIVMDIEIIYQGDASINFSVQSFQCEINQVSFRGTARLTMKPLMDSMPVVGGFELYFMQMPEYDYSLGKLASAAEMPGISNIIKSVLDSIIRRGFVWPNRFHFYFPLESVQRLRDQSYVMPLPQGVLSVSVSRGRHLVKKDKHLLGGKSDPYIVLAIGEKKVSFKDRYADSTVDPEWDYRAEFPVEEVAGLDLKLEVYDYDAGSEDDFMGRTAIPVHTVLQENIIDRWIRLDDTKHGEVLVSAVWKPVLPANMSNGSGDYVVAIYVDSCRNLSSGKSSAPFSKVEMSLSHPSSQAVAGSPLSRADSRKWIPSTKYEAYTTKPRGPTEDPVFQEGHFFLCKNPALDSIAVQVVDHRSGFVLGSACIRINYILGLPDRQFTRMDWPLNNAVLPDATVVLSAKLYAV